MIFHEAWMGKGGQFETEWPDGRPYLISLRPILQREEVVEVVGTIIDITEKKKMEKNMQESEGKYRLIADYTSDLVVVIDRKIHFTYFSPSQK